MPTINEESVKFQVDETSRKNNFNFLRLLFASLVILSHSFELVDGNRSRELLSRLFGTISFGEFAVDGFFLLSGYLIVKSWDAEPKILPFLSKRILRIYPGFIVATLVCAFVVGPLGADPGKYFSQLEFHKLASSMLRLYEPAVPPVFLGQPHEAVNGSMWTIRFEFLCYLSVLALGAIGLVKRRRVWLLMTAACIGLVFLGKLGAQPSLASHVLKSVNLFLRLVMFFFSGGVYYLFRKEIKFKAKIAWPLAGFLILAMFQMPLAEVALATAGGYLLFYFAFSSVPLLARFQTLPDVSYGLYLYGWPIQKLLIWYFPALSAWWIVLISLVAGLLAGLVSWHVVEKVFLKLKPKSTRIPRANPPLTLDIPCASIDRQV